MLAAVTLLWLGLQRGGAACDLRLPQQLRIQDCGFAAEVADALDQSPTLRGEVARVVELHGVVYVVTAAYASLRRRDLSAVLSHQVGVSGDICVLRINLKRPRGPQGIASLAHELQHALEVLQAPEARSEKAIDALFERIGSSTTYGIYETSQALATEAQVLRELRRAGR